MSVLSQSQKITIANIKDGTPGSSFSLSISNDFDIVPCTTSGVPYYTSTQWYTNTLHTLSVFYGTARQSFSMRAANQTIPSTGLYVKYEYSGLQKSIIGGHACPDPSIDNQTQYTLYAAGFSSGVDTGYIVYTLYNDGAVVASDRFQATKNKSGSNIDYQLSYSGSYFSKNKNGNYNPSSIEINVNKIENGSITPYAGNNLYYALALDGGAEGSQPSQFTPPFTISPLLQSFDRSIKFVLYLKNADDSYSKWDQETFQIIKDGADGSNGRDGADGQSAYTIDIINDFDSVPCDAAGNPQYTSQQWRDNTTHIVKPYLGIEYQSTINIYTTAQSGLYIKADADNVTGLTISNTSHSVYVTGFGANGDIGNITYTLYNGETPLASAKFEIVKQKTGATGEDGADGANAVDYYIQASEPIFHKYKDGTMTPNTISFVPMRQEGESQTTCYSASDTQYKTYFGSSTEPSATGAWTSAYELSKTDMGSYTKFKIELYIKQDGNWVKWDQETINLVEDGADGRDGADGQSAYSVTIINDFDSVPCDAEGNPAAGYQWQTETTHIVEVKYNSTAQLFEFVQSGATPTTSGLVLYATITGTNSYIPSPQFGTVDITSVSAYITGMTADTASIEYTLKRGDVVLASSKFETVKQKAGATGEDGADGLDGADAIDYGMTWSASEFHVSKLNAATPSTITVKATRKQNDSITEIYGNDVGYKLYKDSQSAPATPAYPWPSTGVQISASSITQTDKYFQLDLYIKSGATWSKWESETFNIVRDGYDVTRKWLSTSSQIHKGAAQTDSITLEALSATAEQQSTFNGYIRVTDESYEVAHGTTTLTLTSAQIQSHDANLTATLYTDSTMAEILDVEVIDYMPQNTPTVTLSNDRGVLHYKADGTTKKDLSEVTTTSASLLYNGSTLSTGVSYTWALTNCTATGSTTSSTISIDAITGTNLNATAVCTVTLNASAGLFPNTRTYQKTFSIVKQIDGADGEDGADGYNQADIKLYTRADSSPTTPTGTFTYTFATNVLSPMPTGWSREVPDSSVAGSKCYMTFKHVASQDASVTFTDGFSTPIVYVANGLNGADGSNGRDGADGHNGSSEVQHRIYYYATSASATPLAPTVWVIENRQIQNSWTVHSTPLDGSYTYSCIQYSVIDYQGTRSEVHCGEVELYEVPSPSGSGRTSDQSYLAFLRLTNSGTKQGLYWNNNDLYINASYLKTGAISVGDYSSSTGRFYADVGGNTVRIGGFSVDAQALYHENSSTHTRLGLDAIGKQLLLTPAMTNITNLQAPTYFTIVGYDDEGHDGFTYKNGQWSGGDNVGSGSTSYAEFKLKYGYNSYKMTVTARRESSYIDYFVVKKNGTVVLTATTTASAVTIDLRGGDIIRFEYTVSSSPRGDVAFFTFNLQQHETANIYTNYIEYNGCPFFVDTSGRAHMTNALISGHIESTSGKIGGFEISGQELSTDIGVTGDIMVVGGLVTLGVSGSAASAQGSISIATIGNRQADNDPEKRPVAIGIGQEFPSGGSAAQVGCLFGDWYGGYHVPGYYSIKIKGSTFRRDQEGNSWFAGGGEFRGLWTSESALSLTSSRKAKHNISSIDDAYDTLYDLIQPRKFKYNSGTSNRYHLGMIVDEIGDALELSGIPSSDFAAYCLDDPSDPYGAGGLRYEEFIPLNIDQIQKLKRRVSELEEKIKSLENLLSR